MALVALASCTSAQPEREVATIEVGDETLHVWIADSPDERRQGLREVSELRDGVDGMLFVWDEPGDRVFTMEDTLMPLDIWWFDGDLRLIGLEDARPCESAPCPTFPSPGPVLRVLETPAGERAFAAGAVLSGR